MRKMLVLLCGGLILLLLIIYGCQNMAVEMSKGQMLYSSKCSSCHRTIAPSQHSRAEWIFYVDKYGQKLTGEEKQIILEYLAK